MATTTATITINSSDLTGDPLSLSTTTTLYKAGQTVGLENTSGMGRTTYATAAIRTLFADDNYAAVDNSNAHKVYIANKSTDAVQNLLITIEGQVLGKLYAGDWMFIPWTGLANTDIKVTTSHVNMVVEHMVISE